MVLIAYDVDTSNAAGRKRLRKIAKICVDYGQRVQNSVFECSVDSATLVALKSKLVEVMDEDKDSIRFYQLGKNWHGRVEHYGSKPSYDPDGFLAF